MTDVLEGAHIAGCRIEAVAGRGGMGIVYRATQLSLGRPVALKLIAPEHAADASFRERFQRESRMAAAIDHPNVIPVYEAGEEDGRLYLVMRWVAGTDLHKLLRAEGRLEPLRAALIVNQVAGALDAAHAAGLIHRDVKPANVLLSGEHAYLADFGLTRFAGADSNLTTAGHFLGTVDYMAPEQFHPGPNDARADVYALACVLFAALTGAPPFLRETVPATMLAHLHDAPPRPSLTAGVPSGFDRVLARALAKAPEDRYPSAGDFGRAVLAAAEGRSVTEEERSVARGAAAPTVRRDGGAVVGHRRPAAAGGGRTRARARRTGADPHLPRAPPEAPVGVGVRRGRGRGRDRGRDRGHPGRRWTAGSGRAGLRGRGPADGELVRLRLRRRGRHAARAAADLRRPARQPDRAPERARRRRRRLQAPVLPPADARLRALRPEAESGASGRATAKYRVRYEGRGDTTGRMTWTVINERGRPRIALISFRPD